MESGSCLGLRAHGTDGVRMAKSISCSLNLCFAQENKSALIFRVFCSSAWEKGQNKKAVTNSQLDDLKEQVDMQRPMRGGYEKLGQRVLILV